MRVLPIQPSRTGYANETPRAGVVVWNGALERQGLCPGLSGHVGASLAALAMAGGLPRAEKPRFRPRDLSAHPRPTVAQVKYRRLCGFSQRQCARHFEVSVKVIRQLEAR